jgi:hypothetical protein
MLMPGIAELVLTVMLIGGIWLAGAVVIKAADRVDLHRTAAAPARRRAHKAALENARRR